MKIQKKNIFFLGGGPVEGGEGEEGGGGSDGRGRAGPLGGQGGCERRIEVFVKIQKKNLRGGEGVRGGVCGGVRVGVNEELKFL